MTDLTPSQKFALLYIRKASADGLFTKVADTMAAMGIRYTTADILTLRSEGYLDRPPGSTHHRLTPQGSFRATQIVRELARQYGIHHVTHAKPAARNHGPSVSCTCGWSTYASKTNEGRLAHYAARHLESVKAGTYVDPRKFQEFWDAEIAPKLYATSPMNSNQ